MVNSFDPNSNSFSFSRWRVITDYSRATNYNDNFVAIDIETTGLDASTDRITQIAAVKYKDGLKMDAFATYINPHKKIPNNVVILTGITNETVSRAPDFEEIIDNFLCFIGDSLLVCHNADFDLKFLQTTLKHYCRGCLQNRVADTLFLSRLYIIKDVPNHKLPTLKKHLNIGGVSHNAFSDANATGELYMYCFEIMWKEHNFKK